MKFVGTQSPVAGIEDAPRRFSGGSPRLRATVVTRSNRTGARPTLAAFTLLEVMMATVLFAMISLGLIATISRSYTLAAQARYRDHARFVLKSISDQFLILQAQDNSGNVKSLFQPASTATGTGLTWQGSNGSSTGLAITLSPSSGSSVPATVTRKVSYLSSSGTATTTPPASSAGYLLRGDFVVTYTFKGTPYSQSVSLVRAVP